MDRRKTRILLIASAAIVFAAAAACGALAVVYGPRLLNAGPDGMDLRPTPGPIEPEAALPLAIDGYTRGEVRALDGFHGLDFGPGAVQAVYSATGDRRARAIAVRQDSAQEARATVARLSDQLDRMGVLDSRRLVEAGQEESRRMSSVAFWYAPEWADDQRGILWQSGPWCFAVAANQPVARRDVSLGFPY